MVCVSLSVRVGRGGDQTGSSPQCCSNLRDTEHGVRTPGESKGRTNEGAHLEMRTL